MWGGVKVKVTGPPRVAALTLGSTRKIRDSDTPIRIFDDLFNVRRRWRWLGGAVLFVTSFLIAVVI